MSRSTSSLLLTIAAGLAIAALFACGGEDPTPVTPTTTTTTTTQPTPVGLACSPTPPPLYGIQIKVHDNGDGHRRILDSRPIVLNVDNYCQRVGIGSGNFCFVRPEGDAQAIDCDKMAVGQAENGKWGPTWYWDDQLCPTGTNPGCADHPDGNQFLLVAKGPGRFEACAADDIPLSEDMNYPGSRCGGCILNVGSTDCNQ